MNLLAALFGVCSGLMTLSGFFFLYSGSQEADGTAPDITVYTKCDRIGEDRETCDTRGDIAAEAVADASEAETETLVGAALTVSGALLGLGYAVVASAQWRRPVGQYGGMPGPG